MASQLFFFVAPFFTPQVVYSFSPKMQDRLGAADFHLLLNYPVPFYFLLATDGVFQLNFRERLSYSKLVIS